MKRQIKFRAWILKDSENGIVDYMEDAGNIPDPFYEHEVGNIVLMQYTGVHDTNRNEMYEGDIVTSNKGNCVICYDTPQTRFKIVPMSLYLANAGNGGWTGFGLKQAETVIGNIYENSDLIVE